MFAAFPTVALALLISLQSQSGEPARPAQPRTVSPWATASDVELIEAERDSLKGVARLAVSVTVPDGASDTPSADTLAATVAFRLEQAGLEVTTTRAVEEPLLSITLREIDVTADAAGAPPRVAYRVDADLLQLVRLADRVSGRARLMMASTWHAGTFGTATAAGAADAVRARVEEVVDAFLADHRRANAPAPTSPPPLLR